MNEQSAAEASPVPELDQVGLITVGHGTLDRAELANLLKGADVRALVDVRTVPGSRRNPDTAREVLAQWLPAEGISYRWDERLGGFRRLPEHSPDIFWRNKSFRAYAGYTRTPAFLAGMAELLAEIDEHSANGKATDGRVAVLCGETVWWRCHRRIIADYATLVGGIPAWHLMHDGRLVDHPTTAGVRVQSDDLLVYDVDPAKATN
ncbi:DUF488 domain-containing protein [Actinoalloteichus hymeniacidonis]|uniref:DUF488 family protein n=1 Tax=Actinoalloteichus hymeniacidonis TaxID=340345 RepID=A0AAC9HT28_9PSEU|nr:DUF488 domain-containing protein [Actinoalloteichus hymeniacidonis]AOS64855.1 Protein of unknown function, DUF488 [Actinoalloteichus hymeniacidonis]MBB5907070.1 uncharacterized protein (DUF488 family) [Actinoalloteichus hymeniacidonis]